MSGLVVLETALRLPAADIAALIQGRMIAAMPRIFITPGRQFALYPAAALMDVLPPDRYYRSNFLPIVQTVLSQLNYEKALTKSRQLNLFPEPEQLELPLSVPTQVLIKAWARCEACQMLNDPESLAALSRLTIWTAEALQQILRERPYIYLAHLRVYLLPQPIEVPVYTQGHFVPLPRLTVAESLPVLSDSIFARRRHQLENRLPPLHPELEELQGAIAPLSLTNPAAQQLDRDLKIFLGWTEESPTAQSDSDIAWIQTIATTGNSSDGQAFEKLVRRSFIKLGFANSNRNSAASLDPNATGGAGGLDFYCEAPYPVVGECKASKNESVPNSVSAQLIHLGHTHLGKAQFERSVKIIVAAGPLTEAARKAARENKMNVMRPETLQRLLELKAKYPGSIDLFELKSYLQQEPFGEEADAKVNQYIDKVWKKIRLRSRVVSVVKNYLARAQSERADFNALHGAYVISTSTGLFLSREQFHEILVELSSPLTGYLGREEGSDWESDRFYFLRDLNAD